jgi:hypothetical protein
MSMQGLNHFRGGHADVYIFTLPCYSEMKLLIPKNVLQNKEHSEVPTVLNTINSTQNNPILMTMSNTKHPSNHSRSTHTKTTWSHYFLKNQQQMNPISTGKMDMTTSKSNATVYNENRHT